MASTIAAAAGGTGNLGRAIVETSLADGNFSLVILNRKTDEDKENQLVARLLSVDYSSADNIATVLKDSNVQCAYSHLHPQPHGDCAARVELDRCRRLGSDHQTMRTQHLGRQDQQRMCGGYANH
ncbi:hypothetical protein CFIO01_10800 [Colletotrichum fioriniae PJ7]|uniref:NAD(P)-binding domain-containing protein n=1 Tax=Colletotrichum fioriniae PJ7 TaxID=1445577 RepID=A0A010R9X7_9PEZI|nr:hypothetical protein CFIO01_10800 [Colletotrichum fioriniae PJ7]